MFTFPVNMFVGKGSKVYQYVGSQYSQSTLTSWTTSWSGVTVPASSTRLVVVCYGWRLNVNCSAVTIGGISATIYNHSLDVANGHGECMAVAVVPTGTSFDVVTTFSGGTYTYAQGAGISVYVLDNLDSNTPYNYALAQGNSITITSAPVGSYTIVNLSTYGTTDGTITGTFGATQDVVQASYSDTRHVTGHRTNTTDGSGLVSSYSITVTNNQVWSYMTFK